MKAIRIASTSIIIIVGQYLCLIALVFMFDPWFLEHTDLKEMFLFIAGFIVLMISAFGVLKHKAYALWACELILLMNIIVYVIYRDHLGILQMICFVFFIIWFIILALNPPWKWSISEQEKK